VTAAPYLVHHFLEANAARAPEQELLVTHEPPAWKGVAATPPGNGEEGARYSYAAVNAAANRLARLLIELGIQRGDRVAVLAGNGIEYAAGYFGALKAGAIAVPLNTAADPHSLAHYVGDAGARALVVGPRFERLVIQTAQRADTAPGLASLAAVITPTPAKAAMAKALTATVATYTDADALDGRDLDRPCIDLDLASIIYTSGSTGRPRGATLSHLNLVSNVRSIVTYLGLVPTDRVLAVLPFYYVYGQSLLNMSAAAGATVVVENRFLYPIVALDTLERERCTGFAGVPSTFAILLDRSNLAERSLADLRWVTQAGGGMSPALTRRLLEVLGPSRRLHVMYGATEASARLAHLPPDELPAAIGSIGRAIPNVELTVRRPDGTECAPGEDGELFARGANIMAGYWNDPDETARALGPHGYATGDLARRDERGLLWLVGRKKDMLKVGGHRVAAKEIEDALLEHPAVHEAAVIGIPDEVLGDRLRAYVVLRDGQAATANDLGSFLKDRLPAYKIPDQFTMRAELPKNQSGKIMKEALRADAAAEAAGAS
jgi:acyl-CoA synthetase (AMP-forming)/AMP-acid ligase II